MVFKVFPRKVCHNPQLRKTNARNACLPYMVRNYLSEKLIIDNSETTDLEFELKPAFGSLVINTTPVKDAEVYLNGQYTGKTPYESESIPSGDYSLEVKKEN